MYRGTQALRRVGGVLSQACRRQLSVTSAALQRDVQQVQLDRDKHLVQVHWQEGGSSRFPAVWLRDNCQCPDCFHGSSQMRSLSFQKLDPDVLPSSLSCDSGHMTLTWPDGHESRYVGDWLYDRCFESSEAWTRRSVHNAIPTRLWNNESMQNNIPKYTFDELIADDTVLMRWLMTLEELGIALITNTPQAPGQLAKIGARVSHLKKTHYGETFQVQSKHDASNLAYTSGYLDLHSDLPCLHYAPGVQMLHCIKQTSSKGGDNMFVDAFQAATELKRLHPEYFHALTGTPIDFWDVGTDAYQFYFLSQHPTIKLDRHGEICEVHISQIERSSVFNVDVEKVHLLFKALKEFDTLLHSEENRIRYKMAPGDIATINNVRVLHGRYSYETRPGDERHLEGGYLDLDEVRSRRRVIQQALGLQ